MSLGAFYLLFVGSLLAPACYAKAGGRELCVQASALSDFALSNDGFTLSELFERPLPELVVLQQLYSQVSEFRNFTAFRNGLSGFICEAPNSSTNGTHGFQRLWRYLNLLHSNVGEQPLQNYAAGTAVVVGAGPAGLLSALTSVRRGFRVHILEKRITYGRNIWFDLSTPPWANSVALFRAYGFFTQNSDFVKHNESAVITVRCQQVERFFAKSLAIVNVSLHSGVQYVGSCAVGAKAVAVAMPASYARQYDEQNFLCDDLVTSPNLYLSIPADVLIGADSSRSVVRKQSGINFLLQSSLMTHYLSKITVSDLHQTTLLLEIKAHNNTCPLLRRDNATNDTVDPWYPGFIVPGIHSVFKRWYRGHCHLQFLFSHDVGDSLYREYKESGDDDEFLPWHGILQTINLLLNTPYRDTDELKQNVVRRQPGKFEAEMFQISIFKASQIAKVLQLSSAEKPLIVYLIGDSSITAHYRLGVGINNIVTSLRQLRRLLDASVAFLMSSRKFSDTSRLREAVKAVERSSQKRLESMVQFQLSTMLYESYCNAVVFFDGEKSLFESQVVSARDDSSFGYHVLMEEELRELCDAGLKGVSAVVEPAPSIARKVHLDEFTGDVVL